MNTQRTTRKTIALFTAIAGMIMATTTAQAHMLSPAFYADELDRCTAELRTELNTTGAAGLRHTVVDIGKVGVWYVFDIQTNIVDDDGAVIGQAETRCKSHRWREQTVVNVKSQAPNSNLRLAAVD